MRELAPLQSGLDQIAAEDVSRDHQSHHVFRTGRHEAYPIEAKFVILNEAIKFRRRVHYADTAVDPPCSLTCYRRQLDKLSVGEKIAPVIAGAPAAKCKIIVSAAGEHWCGAHPRRKLAGSRFLAITELVDQEDPAIRRRPIEAGRVCRLLGEGTIRATRSLNADLIVKSARTIELDVDRRSCPGIGVDACLDRNVRA